MISTVRVLYVQHRGGSLATISAMATAFFVSNFVFQYPWGWLADRIGRRTVMVVGLGIQAAIGVAYIFVSDPTQFILLRLLEGASAASILPAARASIADMVPDSERGRAYGTFSMFFNLGFLLGPAAGGLLASIRFETAFVASMALRIVAAVIVFGFAGGLPNHSRTGLANEPHGSWRALFNLGLVAAYVVSFGDYLWLGFDQTLAPLWMRHHLGATLALIGIAYSVWALPNALMAPFGGRLADRYPRWALILGAGLCQLPMYGLYIEARSIYVVMVGFVIQACLYAVVSPALDAHLASASPVRARGRVQSAFTAAGLAGAFAGATAFVPLYALNYRLPILVQGVGYGAVIVAGSYMIWLWSNRAHPNAGGMGANSLPAECNPVIVPP